MTTTEKNMTRAAEILGITLKYPATLEAAIKRRTAAQAIKDTPRRDPAAELKASTNPRNYGALLECRRRVNTDPRVTGEV